MTCQCQPTRVTFRANFLAGARRATYKGREHLVVPVVMLRETVVNGALVTLSELQPEGWNGVPVTVGHPIQNGQPITANTPAVREQWEVGMIFNARLDGDKLKGEAWVDIKAAEAVRRGIVDMLESGGQMDVSTGYFSTDVPVTGAYNGRAYSMVHLDLKPDHLALLPDEEGACSWEDGCGVRTNSKGNHMDSEEETVLSRALRVLMRREAAQPASNRRGSDDDPRQIVSDLISNDDTPFVPDDEFSLREMTRESLENLRARYRGDKKPKENAMTTNTPTPPVTPESPVEALTADAVREIVTNAVQETVAAEVDKAVNAHRRGELIAKLVEVTEMDESDLTGLTTNALEKLGAKMLTPAKPSANFSGKGLVKEGDPAPTEPDYSGMASGGVLHHLKQKKSA